ncbi:carbohydrate ABC transporter permease [Ruminiclostridium cellobioparum]|uniref:ABC-type sugar transport system, permease component n=1 Tax=Ruminiclostridium cellobioparum subsp. termitidis CT1112 TaxID=1195236 RepID=S0FXY6_RUMCE|nr:carbohydrate ABC transporter permease [Ruminiclostridium cellobioparum]EMS73438.1 ABC-type sugar transport system, permease component [Ruminiclostridium cellobioparum subsp. termitidis CT1112]
MSKTLEAKRNRKIYITKVVIAAILGIMVVFPIYMMFISSVKPKSDVFDMKIIPGTFTMDGYTTALNENFGRYFSNSLFVSTVVTLVALVFHAMSGYALARLDFVGKKGMFLWIISTLMIPFSVITIPLFILMKQFDWLNSFKGIIIPAIPHAYGIFLYRQFFITMPDDLEEAATIDGCSYLGIFTKIFLPLSKSISVTLGVAFFIANWNNYLWPLIVTQKQSMWVLQVALANFVGRSDTPWNAIMASGVITVIPIIIIFFALQKHLVEGIKMSGLK